MHAPRIHYAFLALALAIGLAPRDADAQAVNYQSRLLGQRALGLGGAFTAIADDPTASYYNPAALTNLNHLQLEVGLPILGLDYQRIAGGLVSDAPVPRDASSVQILALPTTVGAAAGLGIKDGNGNERVVVAATLLIPWQSAVAFRQALASDPFSALHVWQQYEQTLLIGPSIGVHLGPLSVGMSIYYMHENFSWLNARSSATDGTSAESLNSVVEGWFGSLNPRLGILLKPVDRLSLGLMASMSSFRLFGGGSAKASSVTATTTGPVQTLYSKDNLYVDRPLPWELRLGVGFHALPSLTLSLDVSVYFPQRFTFIRDLDDSMTGAPATINRHAIANANLGLEWFAKPTVPLRFGVFTNLSAADAVSIGATPGVSTLPATAPCNQSACVPWINGGGVSASVGAQFWRVMLDFGVNATYGRGFVQQIEAPANFRWSRIDQFALQLFIAGNIGQVINDTTNEIIKGGGN